MSLPKDQYSLANVLDVIDTSDSEFEGFESESDGEFSPYCSNQARIQTDAIDASASVKIFTRTRIVNILLKYI
jgi:hypothetical protein